MILQVVKKKRPLIEALILAALFCKSEAPSKFKDFLDFEHDKITVVSDNHVTEHVLNNSLLFVSPLEKACRIETIKISREKYCPSHTSASKIAIQNDLNQIDKITSKNDLHFLLLSVNFVLEALNHASECMLHCLS